MHFDDLKKSVSNSTNIKNEIKLSKSEYSKPGDDMTNDNHMKNKDEKLLYEDNETEFNKSAPIYPRTSYFQEANSILQEVKSKFLPKGAKIEKVSKKRP